MACPIALKPSESITELGKNAGARAPRRLPESEATGLGASGSCVFKDLQGDPSGAHVTLAPRWVWASGSQLGVILPVPTRGHLAMSGDISGRHNSGSATGLVGRGRGCR